MNRTVTAIVAAAVILGLCTFAGAALVTSQYRADVLALSPIAYYEFEGGSLANSGSTGGPGVATGTPVSSATSGVTQFGDSMDFDSGDYINIGLASAGVDINSDFTVMYWYKDVASADNARIIAKASDAGSNANRNWWFRLHSGEFKWEANQTAGGGWASTKIQIKDSLPLTEAGSPVATGWHMIAAVVDADFDADGKSWLYIDGVEIGIDDTCFNSSLAALQDIYLGDNPGTSGFDGLIDEVALFTTNLSGTQISDLFDAANEEAGPIPEPATMSLLAIGGLGALLRRRRK